MRELRGEHPAGVITEHTMLFGSIQGDAQVPSGVRLVVHGQVAGNLVIDRGGTAEVRGEVTGDVVNRGDVEILGRVVGALRDEAGTARVSIGANIGG